MAELRLPSLAFQLTSPELNLELFSVICRHKFQRGPSTNSYPSLPSPQPLPPVYLLLTIITSPAGLPPGYWHSAQSSGCQDNCQKKPRTLYPQPPTCNRGLLRAPAVSVSHPQTPTLVSGDWGLQASQSSALTALVRSDRPLACNTRSRKASKSGMQARIILGASLHLPPCLKSGFHAHKGSP